MESFEEVLTVGGKSNSLGRAAEVVEAVLKNHARFEELYACISAADPWVRMRAIDSFEKICRVHPEWAKAYIDVIFQDLISSTQPSIQWHLAQIFAEISLSNDQKDRAIAWLKSRILTRDVDWIVSVNVMKALLKFNSDGDVNREELLTLFRIQEQHASKSVRKKASSFIEKINTDR